jgi:U32 family peptidase
MELLAPAGNTVNFLAAMEAGADAVYVGAPAMNARNLARDLSMAEIYAMVDYCHENDKKIYLAANSLIREQDLSQAIKTLATLEALQTDGLIVQDLGLVRLIRKYFPTIPLHASTLLSANNSLSMQGFAELGFERVVLARELTLREIEIISNKTDLEIEVFVHGAMCFSYSGLCLFSSFLGGKSGLRGKCVQPCRRHYSYGDQSKNRGKNKQSSKSSKGKYLFSMNDLSGLEIVPDLQKIGVASLKIEGRLRSVNYVSHIVQAYRLVMDATPSQFPHALGEAKKLKDFAMGRSTSSGYFLSPQPVDAITPHHSGNMGDFLGRLGVAKPFEDRLYAKLSLKTVLAKGDRVRLHAEPSGDRFAFTVKELRMGNAEVKLANAGSKVQLLIPEWEKLTNSKHIDVYRVDVKQAGGMNKAKLLSFESCSDALQSISQKNSSVVEQYLEEAAPVLDAEEIAGVTHKPRNTGKKGGKSNKKEKFPLDFWLRTDQAKTLLGRLPFVPDRFLLPITKENLALTGQLKGHLGRRMRDLTWCLPAIVFESEQNRLYKQVQQLIRSGFRSFQLGHITQFTYFGKERVYLCSDFTVNLMNSQAIRLMEEGGMEYAQLSIESDRKIITELIPRVKRNHSDVKLGLTVYGAPALFTARLDPAHFNYNKTITSPKQEQFSLIKKDNVTTTVPVRPFSLLPYLYDLKGAGLDYAVIDLSNLSAGKKQLEELAGRMTSGGKFSKLPTFNYLGTLE